MKTTTQLGINRTGLDLSPTNGRALVEAALQGAPTSFADEGDITSVRSTYSDEAEPIGSVPMSSSWPPPDEHGLRSARSERGVWPEASEKMEVLMDKLSERLAFERMSSRLYEALIDKARALGSFEGGPSLDTLEQFHDDEVIHFTMLRDAIRTLGGDPTTLTPSADIAGVEATGLLQIMTDPRTSIAQALHALLVAELTDNDGWELLIELAETLRMDELVDRFTDALDAEARHLEHVRIWVSNQVIGDGGRISLGFRL